MYSTITGIELVIHIGHLKEPNVTYFKQQHMPNYTWLSHLYSYGGKLVSNWTTR